MKPSIPQKPSQLIQELIDNIPDVIYFKDINGKLVLVNKAHASGLGLNPEDVIGKTDFNFFPKSQAKSMTEDDAAVMSKGQPIIDRVEYTTQPDGSQHVVSTTKIPRRDKDGNIIGIMGITRDITDRVLKEKALQELHQETNEKLTALNSRLAFEKDKLQQIINLEEELIQVSNIDDLVKISVKKIAHILEAKRCSLLLLDEETRQLNVRGYVGASESDIRRFNRNDKNSVSYFISVCEIPILVSDIEKDVRFRKTNGKSYKTKSFVSVPIFAEREMIGMIHVTEKSPREQKNFCELDLKILEMLAKQIGIAIDYISRFQQLNTLAYSDPMTNLFNYRYFLNILEQELNRVKRYGRPLCLMMIDVDNFKAYNDRYGHLEGNSLLKNISTILRQNLRLTDIACRYAGDEFVVILPETDRVQARTTAEKIIQLVRDEYKTLGVTISAGIAQYDGWMKLEQFVNAADMSLYQAKHQGKNCVYS